MKTVKTILAAAVLLLLFSCAKEIAGVEKPEENKTDKTEQTKDATYSFTVVAAGDISSRETQSKASFEDNAGIVWVSGGKAGIAAAESSSEVTPVASEELSTASISNDRFKASFQFTAAAGSYRIFYPYSADASYGNYRFEVSANQTQAEAGESSDIFALVGTEDFNLEENETVTDSRMKAVGSYIFFQVYGKTGEKLQSIEITSRNTNISGGYGADNDGGLVGDVTGSGDNVKVSLGSEYTVTEQKDNAKGIYAAVLPGNSQNTYTVTTDWGVYTFESSAEKEFKMGAVKSLPLNLTSATSVGSDYIPDQLYLIGDATSAGWVLENAIQMATSDGGSTFICETVLQAGTAREGFKFLKWNSSWADVYVNDNGKLKFYADTPAADDDKKFSVAKAGKYRITANFVTRDVTTELIEEYPEILYQIPGGNAMFIDIMQEDGNGGHVAKILIGKGDGYHDFKIRKGENWYHESTTYPEVNFNTDGNVDVRSREWTVIGDNNSGLGWWINDIYSEKYYDIALNTGTNKVTVTLSQGKKFYIIGINGEWNSFDSNYSATADDSGVAIWNVTVTQACDFKIYGENMVSGDDFFGKGEWYQSQLAIADPQYDIWGWGSGSYGMSSAVLFGKSGDYNRKWKLTETGNFTIEFDTKNLQIKVTKETE